MKKQLSLILTVLLALLLAAALCACSNNPPADTTPGGTTPAATGDVTTDPGSTPTPTTPADGTLDMSGVSFPNGAFTYDGQEHSIAISGELPAGVTVTYTGNGQVDAGKYTVTASFTVPEGCDPVPDMTAIMVIREADPDLSSLGLKTDEPYIFTYDGQPKSILPATDVLPAGVTKINITGNAQTAPGEHTVVFSFEVAKNYKKPQDIKLTMRIDFDTSSCVKDGAFLYMNGQKTSIYQILPSLASAFIKIPDGVTTLVFQAGAQAKSLKSIYVPETVTDIGEYALGYLEQNGKMKKIEGFIVYAAANSAAARYCEANGITCVTDITPVRLDSASDLYIRDGLKVWLDAFASSDKINLEEGKWYSKVGDGYATLMGGKTWWKTRADGGVGYDMTADQWKASAGNVGLSFDTALLPEQAFTVEWVAIGMGPTNADGSRYIDSAGQYGMYNSAVSAFDLGGMRTMQFMGSSRASNFVTRWFYNDKPWANHQFMQSVVKDASIYASPVPYALSMTYLRTAASGKDYDRAQYALFQNGTNVFQFDNYSASADSQADRFIPHSAVGFKLMVGLPGTVYSVRVYDRVLSTEEVRTNHLADILTYYKINTSELGSLLPAELDMMKDMAAGIGFDQDAATVRATLLSALKPEVDVTITLRFVAGDTVETQTITRPAGMAYTVYSPMIKGYYTRTLMTQGVATEDTTITVTYTKIPDGVSGADISKLLPGIVCWGDSITAGAGAGNVTVAKANGVDLVALGSTANGATYPSVLQALIKKYVWEYADVTNCGVGGETSAVIAARAGTETWYLYVGKDMVIPTSSNAKTEISIQQYASSGRLGVLRQGGGNSLDWVEITGKNSKGEDVTVRGLLSMQVADGESGPTCDYSKLTYYFQRMTTGEEEITVKAGAKIVTYGSVAYDGDWCVIFMGQNGGYTSTDELIKQQEEILAACKCPDDKYIIVGLSSGSASSRKGMEDALQARWGDHFLNIRAYLSSEEAFYDAGLNDIVGDYAADIASGTVSDALRIDGVHLNAVGYALLGNALFRKTIELGFYNDLFNYYESKK